MGYEIQSLTQGYLVINHPPQKQTKTKKTQVPKQVPLLNTKTGITPSTSISRILLVQ